MVILDLSIVNVALPSIQSSLNFSSADLQWVIDAYAITFAGFLMLGGRAADQLGQRRVFVAALVLFWLTSLVGGLSHHQRDADHRPRRPGLQLRVHGRVLAGDHHLVVPARPAAPPRDRPVGGDERARRRRRHAVRRDHHPALSWRWVLLINPPIGIVTAVIACGRGRPAPRTRAGRSFDIAGAVTLTVGQMVLVYGVVQAGLRSWHAARRSARSSSGSRCSWRSS